MSAPNRDRAPDVWWSFELGLIWSDDAGRTYQRVEDGRVVEFFHLPWHAQQFDSQMSFSSTSEAA
jgi:hypothetical protein